ncbi:MAG: redoxin domain-containing protein, partial [Chloroflexi bacterium]|nr:redoxin domain-containing protein [Chloroflexota bacterium]
MLNRIPIAPRVVGAAMLASGLILKIAPAPGAGPSAIIPRTAGHTAVVQSPASGEGAPDVAPLKKVRWVDLGGQSHDLARIGSGKAAVFLFIATECPVTNLYTPRILDLWKSYRDRGVPFYLVDSNPVDTAAVLRKYVIDRGFPFPVLKDSGTVLADWLGAYATPEAIVVDGAGMVRYRGGIDDNRDRSKVIRQNLREALDDVLAGSPVARPRTVPFGCRIFRDVAAMTPRPAGASPVTYARDVAPILDRSCVSCHRPGESAPFSLTTFKDAQAWALPIRDNTVHRLMPPWKASPGFGSFKDARFLSNHDINTIARWVDAGAPAGNLR